MQNEQQEIHGTTVPVSREEAERGSVDPHNIPGRTALEEDGSPVVDEQDVEDDDLREEVTENEDQDPDTEGQP